MALASTTSLAPVHLVNSPFKRLRNYPAIPTILEQSSNQQAPLSLTPINLSVRRIRQQIPHLPIHLIPPPAFDPVRLLLQV